MKIAGGIDKRFAAKTGAKQVVLKITEIDRNDINREIALI